MKILLTGAGGFIGTALSAALESAIIDGQHPELFHLKRPGTGATSLTEDSVGAVPIVLPGWLPNDFTKALGEHRFEYVVHLASYGVARDERSIDRMIDGNITFLANLLSALGPTPRLIVNIGSCAEYGHIGDGNFVIDGAPLRPLSMYGGAKAAAEMMATALAHENGQRLTTLRLFGVYGEGEGPQRLLPFLVSRMLRRERVDLTTGTQVRDWLHIRDVVSGIIAMLNASATGADVDAAYNLCSGVGISVRKFVDEICLAMDIDDGLLRWGAITRVDEPKWLVGDPERFRQITACCPRVELRDGVAAAVAHYRALEC